MCEIETAETYDKGRPKRGGLSDPRMGTMDRAMKCETDGMNSTDTPGYFGHLELAKPVYHHGFIKNLVNVLRCVGFSSSKLMIDKVRAEAACKTFAPAPPSPIVQPLPKAFALRPRGPCTAVSDTTRRTLHPARCVLTPYAERFFFCFFFRALANAQIAGSSPPPPHTRRRARSSTCGHPFVRPFSSTCR